MNRIIMIAIVATSLVLAGCGTTRTSTTDRTPLEQALISQSAYDAVGMLNFTPERDVAGMSYYLDDSQFKSVDQEYILNALREHLLKLGMRETTSEDEADVHIFPRSAHVGVHDRSVLLGIPSLPIIIPGAGTLTTPELALYKYDTQRGRSRVGGFGVIPETGELAFSMEEKAAQRRFTRYTVLFLFSFKRTNLEYPF